MDEVCYRPYQPGDEVAINHGFNEVFGAQRSLAEWEWKFPSSALGRAVTLAVDASGRVIAHYAAIPVPFVAGGTAVWAGQIVDIWSRAEARQSLAGARVFRTLVRRFVEHWCGPDRLAVTYGFPGRRHMELVRLGIGSHGSAEMPPQDVAVWSRPMGRPRPALTGHRVAVGLDVAAVDALWRRIAERYRVTAVRDAAWLRRRFTSRPGVGYLELGVVRRGVLRAWAVVRVAAPVTSLADLAWDGDDARALVALDRAVARAARDAGAARVEMWLMGDRSAEAAFERLGWDRSPHPGCGMAAYTFRSALDASTFPGNAYVTMADADLA